MTEQISNALVESLKPKGVAIIVEARHMCMELRGVKKVRSSTHTRSFNGVFEKNNLLRSEFYKSLSI